MYSLEVYNFAKKKEVSQAFLSHELQNILRAVYLSVCPLQASFIKISLYPVTWHITIL